MKQFKIQIAGERIQISAKSELNGFAQPVESLKVVRLECWNAGIVASGS
jgi:hypothetical protein